MTDFTPSRLRRLKARDRRQARKANQQRELALFKMARAQGIVKEDFASDFERQAWLRLFMDNELRGEHINYIRRRVKELGAEIKEEWEADLPPPPEHLLVQPENRAYFMDDGETPKLVRRLGTGASVAALYHARHVLPGEAIPNTWDAIRDRAKRGIENAQIILADAPYDTQADILISRASNYGWLYGLNRYAASVSEFTDLIKDDAIRAEAEEAAYQAKAEGRVEGNRRRRVQGVSRARYCVIRALWRAYQGYRNVCKAQKKILPKEIEFDKEQILRLANAYVREYREDCRQTELYIAPVDPFGKEVVPFLPSVVPAVAGKIIRAFVRGAPVKEKGMVGAWRVRVKALEDAMDIMQAELGIRAEQIADVAGSVKRGMIPIWEQLLRTGGKWGKIFADHYARVAPAVGYSQERITRALAPP